MICSLHKEPADNMQYFLRGKITFESCFSGDSALLQALKDPNTRR